MFRVFVVISGLWLCVPLVGCGNRDGLEADLGPIKDVHLPPEYELADYQPQAFDGVGLQSSGGRDLFIAHEPPSSERFDD